MMVMMTMTMMTIKFVQRNGNYFYRFNSLMYVKQLSAVV